MTDPAVTTLVDVATSVTAPIDEESLAGAVSAAVRIARLAGDSPAWLEGASLEASIRVTDDDEIRRLNRQYRNVDRATDVLSFSLIERPEDVTLMHRAGVPVQLGEIVLSWEYCVRQAAALGHSVEMELSWLTIHGTLQLLGYTHDNDRDAARMEELECRALTALGYVPP